MRFGEMAPWRSNARLRSLFRLLDVILSDFFGQKDNRISYQNALVMEEEGEVVGVAIFYDGAKARELDVALERSAAKKSGDSNYSIPTEAEASEFYMDALSVTPYSQGKGYGRKLIKAACDRARKLGHHRIALLVEVDHEAAKRLYERVGFCMDYYKADRGTRILSHGTEFVMYQGVRAVQSGKNFQVSATVVDSDPNPRNAPSSFSRSLRRRKCR
jgi:ribosomal protein S18 acetylase RimI-like enzyme